jgi:predicted O-methyltransferase YrrM
VSAIHLAELIHSPAIASEWRDVSQMLDTLEYIEDMKTGGVNPGDRRALYHLVRRYEPSSVLEIGTHVAASTMSIAAALKRQPRSRLVTVDIQDVNAPDGFWHRFGLKRPPDQRMAAMGMADRVTFVNADSLDYLRNCKETFDLIFLDGDHSATTVYREVPAALALLNDGGVIVLHDLFPRLRPLWSNGAIIPGPELATRRLRKENSGLTVVPLGALAWPTKLGSNVTSLALLARA